MLRIGINGFGRIGRCVLRALMQSDYRHTMQVVAINEPAPIETIAHLLKYDSTHGTWHESIKGNNGCLQIGAHRIVVSHEEKLADIYWPQVDIVLECSSQFTQRTDAEQHLQQGATKVLFSQPAQNELDATIVYGLNQHSLKKDHCIASAASCTTNAVAPVIDYLHQQLGIQSGVITTLHSAMNDQPVIDAYHHTDLRKTRSAMRSMIPVDTALARGIDRVLPELQGRFEAQAMRVPTIDVSAIDLSVVLNRSTSAVALNDILLEAANGVYQGIIGVSDEPLASCDFLGDLRSAVVDTGQTRVAGGNLAKLLIWFDNEWAYANRMLDVTDYWFNRAE